MHAPLCCTLTRLPLLASSHMQRARLHDLFMESRRRILNNRFTPVSAFSLLCGAARAAHDDDSS